MRNGNYRTYLLQLKRKDGIRQHISMAALLKRWFITKALFLKNVVVYFYFIYVLIAIYIFLVGKMLFLDANLSSQLFTDRSIVI